jgi:signal transduction histidine kinase
MSDGQPSGIALLCDAQGVIVQVLRNDLDLPNAGPGQLFLRILDPGSWHKALSFLAEIKAQGAAFDWELNVAQPEQAVTLHFAGGVVGEGVLMVGAANGRFAAELYEALTAICNAQTNQLRAALQERSQMARAHAELDSSLYDEISRLNNELVAMQRELAQKNAELARLNELKSQFLGMAAHDLRNPLTVIMAYSEFLLQDAAQLSKDQHDFLTTINRLSQFMTHLVNDLLDVAAIESGRLELDLAPVDLATWVSENVARNRLLAARKQIDLQLTVAATPRLLVDASKIEQVLDNLISNAIKFSPPGSQVQVILDQTDDGVRIAVRDQGPGISPEDQERLFKPFQRARTEATGGEKSTGLGLVIVKRIVEAHGGRIWLESQVGEGSTFYVVLPQDPGGLERGAK